MRPTAHFDLLVAGLVLLPSPAHCQLNALAQAAGLKYFGTAVDNAALGNAAYMAIARNADEFGMITPANSQKWDTTEPSQGRFNYGSADALVRAFSGGKQKIRCHTLVWYSQLPGWVNGGRDQMARIIQTHIQNVMGHFKGACYAWDVVNEALEDDGRYRNSPSMSPVTLFYADSCLFRA